ncbi:hypothetical protein EVAR_28362_1 [Eumeta japonica]|uniref:Uncharacterized protein n=1 Tax=Eumeta variegata TaxID=151549 RepID=A0A4C1V9S4_EUMVA|nr:hypothetical protein EVAR_28362_1 [Eumeta japonica]
MKKGQLRDGFTCHFMFTVGQSLSTTQPIDLSNPEEFSNTFYTHIFFSTREFKDFSTGNAGSICSGRVRASSQRMCLSVRLIDYRVREKSYTFSLSQKARQR